MQESVAVLTKKNILLYKLTKKAAKDNKQKTLSPTIRENLGRQHGSLRRRSRRRMRNSAIIKLSKTTATTSNTICYFASVNLKVKSVKLPCRNIVSLFQTHDQTNIT